MLKVLITILLISMTIFSFSENMAQSGISLIRHVIKNSNYELVIYIKKSDFKLILYDRQVLPVKVYNIGLGSNPDMSAKLYKGDNRTPEGVYKITQVLSRNMNPESDAYKLLKKMNSVYFRAADGYHKYGYPNRDLGKGAYGYGFLRINYPNKKDKRLYKYALKMNAIPKDKDGKIVGIGSGLAIHGNNDPVSIGHLASSGCVRMRNSDLAELIKHIRKGTPVIIER